MKPCPIMATFKTCLDSGIICFVAKERRMIQKTTLPSLPVSDFQCRFSNAGVRVAKAVDMTGRFGGVSYFSNTVITPFMGVP